MKVLLFLEIFVTLYAFVCCLRNAQEEDICRHFLFSKETNPLSEISRQLDLDEDGEFSCELVLQDNTLPIQIRTTIHEGLSWLAVRHTQMGLKTHNKVFRHLSILADMFPRESDFSVRAGFWGMDPHVNEHERAARYLNNSLASSVDNSEELYVVRREYGRCLSYLGRYSEALDQLTICLRQNPLDYFVAGLVSDLRRKLGRNDESLNSLLQPVRDASIRIKSVSINHYESSCDQEEILRVDYLPSPSEFYNWAIFRRCPVVISLGTSLNDKLHWETQKWKNTSYLAEKAGEIEIQVETHRIQPSPSDDSTLPCDNSSSKQIFGFGVDSIRRYVPFADFLSPVESFSSHQDHVIEYLNTQAFTTPPPPPLVLSASSKSSSTSVYRAPLVELVDDIPFPLFLSSFESRMTDVTLWMYRKVHQVELSPSSITSRLHVDALDNVYVVLQGQKEFRLISPRYATAMDTISPTYYVSKHGMSFQFNPNRIESFLPSDWKQDFPVSNITKKYYSSWDMDTTHFHFSRQESLEELAIPCCCCCCCQSVDSSPDLKDSSSTQLCYHNVKLEAGDMLFLPMGWFHDVSTKSAEDFQAINYWWKPPNWQDALQEETFAFQNLLEELFRLENENCSIENISNKME